MALEYPQQVKDLLEAQKAITTRFDIPGLVSCPNCYDQGIVYYIELDGQDGPFRTPPLGKKSHYLTDVYGRGSGWYPSHLVAVQCPACKSSRLSDWMERKCGLTGTALKVGLSDFERLRGKEAAHAELSRLLSMNRQPCGFTTFYGGYGRGKSFALKILVNSFRLMGVMAIYTELANLLAAIRERFGETTGITAEGVIEYFRDVRVLAVDELDKVNLTAWARETIQRLLSARYDERDRYLTCLGTNLPPAQLPDELGYLRSRMTGGEIIEVAGEDMRPAVNMNRKDWE